MYCLFCGAQLPDKAVFCNVCGKNQNDTNEGKPVTNDSSVICANCSNTVSKDAKTCIYCGQPTNTKLKSAKITVSLSKVFSFKDAINPTECVGLYDANGDVLILSLKPNDIKTINITKDISVYVKDFGKCVLGFPGIGAKRYAEASKSNTVQLSVEHDSSLLITCVYKYDSIAKYTLSKIDITH